ncbi:MAG TPA: histidine--tRNA ligase [Vicinamibacterales bacterium]
MSDATKPARGMRDFLPDDVRRRAYVIGVVAEVYERYGFEPLETPAVENIETLMGKYGEDGNRLIFKILKRGEHERTGEADLALRYDLTVPLARVVAEHRGRLPRFFKRYQIQPVWRADRPARGRFREFYQCDVDAIGSTSPVVEADVCAAVSEVLERLGFNDFVVRLNHREVLRALLDGAGVPGALHDTALVAIDKLDKIGPDGVRGELETRGIDAAAAARTLDAFARPASPSNESWLGTLESRIPAGHAPGLQGLATLRSILALSAGTPAGPRLQLDPSLARGLSYYTGAIFEIAVPDLAGSLGGGGRYDGLIGMFSGEQVPACGFSLGLERILVVMGERGMFPASVQTTGADVLATIWNADAAGDTLALARMLRAAGLRVEVYPEADKLGKQMKYAASRGIPFAVIVGDDERAAGTVMVKDLRTGGQQPVPRGEAAGWIRDRLSPAPTTA